jgi:hypothetical protein
MRAPTALPTRAHGCPRVRAHPFTALPHGPSRARTHGLAFASSHALQVFPIEDLPSALLLDILMDAGAWPEEEGQPMGHENRQNQDMPVYSALRVCRHWRDLLMGSPPHMVQLLLNVHEGCMESAFVGACGMGHCAAAARLLELPDPLLQSLRLLLGEVCLDGADGADYSDDGYSSDGEAPWPRADCRGGEAFWKAAANGHESVGACCSRHHSMPLEPTVQRRGPDCCGSAWSRIQCACCCRRHSMRAVPIARMEGR